MNRLRSVVALLLACGVVSGCGGAGSTAIRNSESKKQCSGSKTTTACVCRVVEYFKEIGSYPTLTSAPNAGRSAESVARERCERTNNGLLAD
jgi:ABC-type phosphate transport system substrate-binding protein